MNKKLLALAVAAAVSSPVLAFADGVELYGILDVAVASVTNSYNANSNFSTGVSIKGGSGSIAASNSTGTLTGMLGGGIQASRWGIKGSEDLGDGMKALFMLESGFQLPSGSLANNAQSLLDAKATVQSTFGSAGSTNGELFGRTAWLGLSDKDLGTVKFGKNYVLAYDVYGGYDAVQNAGLFSAVGTSGTFGGGMGVTELVRQANSVKYTNKVGDINYGAMYKFGNTAGSSSAGSAYGFNVGYEKDRFGVQAVYQSATDAANESASTSSALKLTYMNTNGYLIATKYKFSDQLTGKASYQRYYIDAPSDLSLACPTTFNNLSVASCATQGVKQATTIASVGADYGFSDRLKGSVAYYSVNIDASGTSATSTAAVTETYTSALLDYALGNNKRTDVYVGGMAMTTNSALVNTTPNKSNQTLVAAGIRHKF